MLIVRAKGKHLWVLRAGRFGASILILLGLDNASQGTR